MCSGRSSIKTENEFLWSFFPTVIALFAVLTCTRTVDKQGIVNLQHLILPIATPTQLLSSELEAEYWINEGENICGHQQ